MIPPKNILFHVNATSLTGLGHIMRCISLAKRLRQLSVSSFFVGKYDQAVVNIMREQEFRFHLSDTSVLNWSELSEQEADALVVDLPHDLSDSEIESIVALQLPFAVLDDHGKARDHAKLVINSIAHPDMNSGSQNLFCGEKYMILPQELLDLRSTATTPQNTLFISMGGSDPFNITQLVLKELAGLEVPCDLVIGPANKSAREILRICKDLNHITIHNQPTDRELFMLLSRCSIALISFGITAYHTAFLAKPTITIAHHDSGVAAASAFEERISSSIFLGRYDCLNSGVIGSSVNSLLADTELQAILAKNGTAALDGQGQERCVELLTSHLLDLHH